MDVMWSNIETDQDWSKCYWSETNVSVGRNCIENRHRRAPTTFTSLVFQSMIQNNINVSNIRPKTRHGSNTQHTNICRNDSAYSGYEIRRVPDVQTLTVVGILGHSDNSHWLVGNICSKYFGVAACVLVWSQHRPAGPVWPVDEVCIDGEPVEVSRSWFNYDLKT